MMRRARVSSLCDRARRRLPVFVAAVLLCATSPAPGETQLYAIGVGHVTIGSSRIEWRGTAAGRRSDAVVHLDAMLDQHDRLQLDPEGRPVHYRLDASVQGRETRIEVWSRTGTLTETVTQAERTRTVHLACPQPVDFVDNNSLDGLQALLDRHRGNLAPGSAFKVFVPQALAFGTLRIVSTRRLPRTGDRQRVRIEARLSVKEDTVPLTLEADARNGRLLRYRQPQLGVTAILLRGPQPIP